MEDSDVEELRSIRADTDARTLKRCDTCKQEKPADTAHFSRNKNYRDGLSYTCKECRRVIDAASYKKLKAKKDAAIDKTAPNIASKSIDESIETQSITENTNDIKHKDIDQMQPNNDVVTGPDGQKHYPAVMPPGRPERNATTMIRTCSRCSYSGPEQSFHKAGSHGFIDICLKCVAQKREKNRLLKEQGLVEIGPDAVVIDFAEYPEIKQAIEAAAKAEFRTVPNEILYRLVHYAK